MDREGREIERGRDGREKGGRGGGERGKWERKRAGESGG